MKYQNFDYYKALGVDSSASASQIKKAFLKISLKYHPDKALTFDEREKYKTLKESKTELLQSDKELLDKFEQKVKPFIDAAVAHETLSDSNEREKYDKARGIRKSGSASSDPEEKNGYGKKEETNGKIFNLIYLMLFTAKIYKK